jgi:glutaredoxin
LAAAVAAAACQGDNSGRPAIVLYVFYSKDCEHCGGIKPPALAELGERAGCDLRPRYFDVADAGNYKLLVYMEKALGEGRRDLPVVIVGRQLLGGASEIEQKLETTIRDVVAAGGVQAVDLPPPDKVDALFASAQSPQAAAVRLAYFEQPGCRQCARVEHLLRALQAEQPSLRIERYVSTKRETRLLLEAFCERAGVPEDRRLLVPAVFAGGWALVQDEITDDAVAGLVQEAAKAGVAAVEAATDEELAAARSRLTARFRRVSVVAVVLGGLVDGVNPCAFATIVFLITYLVGIGKSRRQVLHAGACFCAGVFIAYLLVGLGLSEAILRFEALPAVALAVRWALAAAVFALSALSLHDAWVAWRGAPRSMLLKLPDRLRMRMNALIARRARAAWLAPASLALGFAVSMLELVCTGQVYLPLIQVMLLVSVDRLQTGGLLLLYNLAFIAPLAGVFLAVFFGVRSDRLQGVLQAHVAPAKVLLAILFLALALLLVML